MPASSPTVAWLGTGTMGLPMCRRLLQAGLELRVWNRTSEKAQPLGDEGATVAEEPYQAAEGADLLVTMLSDADAVADAVTTEVLEALAPDAVWVQMSTVGIVGTQRLHEAAQEDGVTFVDAPVLGTKAPAESGALTVLASGPEEALDRSAPVFDAVGARTLRVGEAGAGSRLKLVANTWVLLVNDGVAQVLSLARGLKVDPQQFLEAIGGGPLDAPYVHAKGAMMLDDEFPPSFSVDGAVKDAGLIVNAAREAGVDARLMHVVRTHLERASEAGYGDADMAAVVKGHGAG